MESLWLLITCLGLGVFVRHFAQPPIGLAQMLNWWVINIALPALVLAVVPTIHLDTSLWFLIISQWLVFGGAWLLFATIGPKLHWSRSRIGAMVLVCGLGNTAFMGYPLIQALRGDEGLALAVIADQVGCFIALAIGGAVVAAVYSGKQPKPAEIGLKILRFPPFIAMVVGFAASALGGWPSVFRTTVEQIGQTLTPLALFSVGLRLRLRLAGDQALPVTLGLGWKLLLAPALALALGWYFGVRGPVLGIGVLEAAMAPMISAAILADQHKLDPPLANAILGIGILLSLVIVPMWHLILPG